MAIRREREIRRGGEELAGKEGRKAEGGENGAHSPEQAECPEQSGVRSELFWFSKSRRVGSSPRTLQL